jgi:hypothetical protein
MRAINCLEGRDRPTRRSEVVLGIIACFALSCGEEPAPKGASPAHRTRHVDCDPDGVVREGEPAGHERERRPETCPLRRAKDAWSAMQRGFSPHYVLSEPFCGGNSTVPCNPPNIFFNDLANTQPTSDWGQAEVVHAALNIAQLTDEPADWANVYSTIGALPLYLYTDAHGVVGTTPYTCATDPGLPCCSTAAPCSGIRWWDENGAVADVWLQAYEATADRTFLDYAQGLWPFFLSGQSNALLASDGIPGGQWENEMPGPAWNGRAIAVAANGRDDIAIERLMLLGQNKPEYANFVQDNDTFVRTVLRLPDGSGWYYGGYYANPCDEAEWYGNYCLSCETVAQPPGGSCTSMPAQPTCAAGVATAILPCDPARPSLPCPLALRVAIPGPHICDWIFDNDLGYMIKSDVLRYRLAERGVSRNSYLEDAYKTATIAMARFSQSTTEDWLWKKQPVTANADFFAGLLLLSYYFVQQGIDPMFFETVRDYIQQYADRLLTALDPATGLYTGQGVVQIVNDQSGVVKVWTLLAWPFDRLPNLH